MSNESKTRDKLHVVLLQARDPDDPTRVEEVESFARRAGLTAEQVTPMSVIESRPEAASVRFFDAVFVGGAGDYFVSKNNLPYPDAFYELLLDIVARRQPMFASCFGFQSLSKALGGNVVHAPERTEVGTFDLELTAHGERDPLMSSLPRQFRAQMGRKDIVDQLPDGVDHLASSELCPHQALRVHDAPIWATQFHPELDHHTNRRRFETYLESYQKTMSPEEIQRSLDSYRESPESAALLERFIDLVFG